jgi:hypothetical protein
VRVSPLPLATVRHGLVATLTAFALAVGAVVFVSWQALADGRPPAAAIAPPVVVAISAPAEPGNQDVLLVIGDSITSRFNDKSGAPMQGFWSMIARDVGAEAVTRAQGGAGFVNPGLARCKGRTFGGQLARASVREIAATAGALIIEGGRNDTRICAKGGGHDLVSSARLRREANRFFADVRALRGPDDCTVVFTPWGPKGAANRDRITKVIRASAGRHGFRFIDTAKVLTRRNSLADQVHPNRRGNLQLAERIVSASFMRTCFA